MGLTAFSRQKLLSGGPGAFLPGPTFAPWRFLSQTRGLTLRRALRCFLFPVCPFSLLSILRYPTMIRDHFVWQIQV
ncbi:hypothetical protein [Citrobacter portucalensis]|uniref:hypothetical protein n=1 Tax=Citrobacter portucalensis TaxID=1639133 RepID=UPI0025508865|nr:hypothetical protein [Citrobacter portucalensis]